jgi:tRNA G46 methylase TrmB|tara:strand:+ start:695 stop:1240 length:546 start_codon:yes stop_codon:yes gene_type:complete
MKSSEYTKELVKKRIKNWKDTIANGEFLQVLNAQRNDKMGSLYKVLFDRSWIYKTILDNKVKNKLDTCNNIVLVGCGLYPYSLFDMHQRFPHIKYYGIEISKKRANLAQIVVDETPAKDNITICCSSGENFDYSFLGDEDMIFISVDVVQDKIIDKIVKTSGAQIYSCAPYKSSYVNGIIT